MSTHSQIIPTIFQYIVTGMSFASRSVPFYFGYWPEISTGLRLQGLVKTNDGLKYPCIVMHSAITEQKGSDFRYLAEISCKFVIIAETKATYTTLDRITNVYTPTLYPLYAQFIDALQSSQLVDINQKDNLGQVAHQKQDLYFMGSLDKNQNQISDIVDAIEITFKNLKVFKFTY